MKHSKDREDAVKRNEFDNLWKRLLEIETELQSNGHTFDFEDQQTWPTL